MGTWARAVALPAWRNFRPGRRCSVFEAAGADCRRLQQQSQLPVASSSAWIFPQQPLQQQLLLLVVLVEVWSLDHRAFPRLQPNFRRQQQAAWRDRVRTRAVLVHMPVDHLRRRCSSQRSMTAARRCGRCFRPDQPRRRVGFVLAAACRHQQPRGVLLLPPPEHRQLSADSRPHTRTQCRRCLQRARRSCRPLTCLATCFPSLRSPSRPRSHRPPLPMPPLPTLPPLQPTETRP
mmetsp:Transcript_15888/g.34383  ORF Transcript_15888/g.34383 Transcript_15888/m.34383 type:complete len:234 (+) Transcript_15888:363-1064(+)